MLDARGGWPRCSWDRHFERHDHRRERAGSESEVRAARYPALQPSPGSLDAATVFFSLIADVTQSEIRSFIAKIHGLLKPGGLFVFATVPLPAESLQINWMGRPVVVSSLAPEDAVASIKDAGFQVEHEALSKFTPRGAEAGICSQDDVWEETHLFVCARKLKPAST